MRPENARCSSIQARMRANRRLIWQGLQQSAAGNADFTAPAGSSATVVGYLDLGRAALTAARNPFTANEDLADWRGRYPSHPANTLLNEDVLPELGVGLEYPAQIGLILPLSGRQQGAGTAVRDGFLAALLQQAARRWPSPAMLMSMTRSIWSRITSASFRRPACPLLSMPSLHPRAPRKRDCCSKTGSSCRACISPGTLRRCSAWTMRSWIWWRTFLPEGRPRGCTAHLSTSSASRPKSRLPRTRASCPVTSRSLPLPLRAARWRSSTRRSRWK